MKPDPLDPRLISPELPLKGRGLSASTLESILQEVGQSEGGSLERGMGWPSKATDRSVAPSLAPHKDGILPIAKSDFWTDWGLPGHGAPYHDCGSWRAKGCLNVKEHAKNRLDGICYAEKAYVKFYRRSCGRGECPVCYEKWCALEAKRASRRLRHFFGHGKPIHVVVSPNQHDCETLDYVALRKKAYKALKRVHVVGGLCIIHPFRESDEGWFLSPHFHVIGFGWVSDVAENFAETDTIVKNVGTRETLEGTIHYQLSHAGVFYGKPKKATITWFGSLSYAKMKVNIEEEERETCPLCGKELISLKWIHVDRPPPEPKEEGEFFLDARDWRPAALFYP